MSLDKLSAVFIAAVADAMKQTHTIPAVPKTDTSPAVPEQVVCAYTKAQIVDSFHADVGTQKALIAQLVDKLAVDLNVVVL